VAIPKEHREVLYGDLLLKYYGEEWKCFFLDLDQQKEKACTGIS
jgi:hypothetical protein